VAIIGAGNGGLAFAGYLARRGVSVRIFDKDAGLLAGLAATGTIEIADGDRCEAAPAGAVCGKIGEAVAGADFVFVVTPADRHREVAAAIAPFLRDDAPVLLHPGRTGGALEVKNVLAAMYPGRPFIVGEAQTLLFACRRSLPNKVVIKGVKRQVAVGTLPRAAVSDVLARLKPYFPQFYAADSVLETSLNNIGAVFHPAPTLLNAARIETDPEPFQYYLEGISPAVAAVLAGIDAERLRVAQRFGVRAPSAREWLHDAYGVAAADLYGAIQGNSAYRGIFAPRSIRVRYLDEDVPTGLVPLAALAKVAGEPAPLIEAVIDLAASLRGTDYRRIGRSLDRMGLAGLTAEEIRALVAM